MSEPIEPAPTKDPTAARTVPAWVQENQTLAVVIAFVVVFLYVLPVFIIGAVALATDGFQSDSFWFAWFAAFMESADSTLNQYHKILLPIVTGISVVAFRGPSKGMVILGGFILVSFAITLFVAVVFDMGSIKTAIGGLGNKMNLELTNAFFSRIQESLMMYLSLLLGIGIANKK